MPDNRIARAIEKTLNEAVRRADPANVLMALQLVLMVETVPERMAKS